MAIASTASASGKTVLIATCLAMFSNIKKKPTYIITTGDFKDYYSLVTELGVESSCSTQELISACNSRDILSALSFATSLTPDGVYALCSLNGAGDINSKVEAYDKFGALVNRDDIIATELCNNADLNLNRAIAQHSDLLLVIVNTKRGISQEVTNILNRLEYSGPYKVIVTKYNPVISTKKLDSELGSKKYMIYSYNPYIEKLLYDGQFIKLVQAFRKRTPEGRATPQEIRNILNMIISPKKFPEVNTW